jgi:DNA invertase Pin-like site-specific DNA recombinase
VRAALYTRYSTEDQSSTPAQLAGCRRRAEAEGWPVVATYSDEAISGDDHRRPQYQAMLAAARDRSFEVLIVEDLSRLARDSVESELAIRRLEHWGVRVVGLFDGYDSTHRGRKLLRGMRGLMNDLALDEIRDRTHRSQRDRAEKSLSAGGLPYGYRAVDAFDGTKRVGRTREIDPARADIVREVFDRFAAGESLRVIANDLNRRGLPSPGAGWNRERRASDGLWRVSALHSMLGNEAYAGRYTWNRTQWVKDPETKKRERRERPKADWIVREWPELRIVDEDTWQRVQTRMGQRATLYGQPKGGRARYLLSGLLRCGECGGAYIVAAHRPVRYGCATHRQAGAAGCSNSRLVAREVAERLILADVRDQVLSPEAVALAVRVMREEAKAASQPGPDPEVEAVDRDIEAVERLRREGVLSPRAAAAALEPLRAQRAAMATRATSVVAGAFGAESDYVAVAGALWEAITGDDVDEAREALRGLLGTVRLVVEGEELVAEMAGGAIPLRRAVGGSTGLVAGAGFGASFSRVRLVEPARSPHSNAPRGDRNAEIRAARAAGASFAELARRYGISEARVRQLCGSR